MNRYEVLLTRKVEQTSLQVIEAEDIYAAERQAEMMRSSHFDYEFEEDSFSVVADVAREDGEDE